jgi:NAD-dependent SIR2 family protein deacetylase
MLDAVSALSPPMPSTDVSSAQIATQSSAHDAADAARLLRAWLARFERVLVLTGAGISTASGIPDYRDSKGDWKRPPPVSFQALTGDAATYRRYWARSFVGWPRMHAAQPNAAHAALAAWQARGGLSTLITQNVDGLHQRAGSREVIDLHGRLDAVVCLGCGAQQPRLALQARMAQINVDWRPSAAATAPDGDADLSAEDAARFIAPHCTLCDGLLKPDVVFFGENVPGARYRQALDGLHAADALLVIGSSLMVYSGFRFARMASERGQPLALLTRGKTRADALADLKLDADCVQVLPAALGAH